MTEDRKHNKQPFDPAEIVDLEGLAAQLRDTYAHLFTEQGELVKNANVWLAATSSGIKTDEMQGVATEIVAQLLDALDGYHGKPNSVHTLAKEPFLKGGRICDAVLNAELAGPVRDVIEQIKAPMKAYAVMKARRLAEEAAEASRKAAEEAARVAALAALSAKPEDLEAAMEAEQAVLDEAMQPNLTYAKASQTRGDLGGLSNLRGKWKARITNAALVPDHCKKPDLELIEFKMNQSKDKKTGAPTIEIPGVEFFQDVSLSVRR